MSGRNSGCYADDADKVNTGAMESALVSGRNSRCYADDALQGKYWGNGICMLGQNSGCYADDADKVNTGAMESAR